MHNNAHTPQEFFIGSPGKYSSSANGRKRRLDMGGSFGVKSGENGFWNDTHVALVKDLGKRRPSGGMEQSTLSCGQIRLLVAIQEVLIESQCARSLLMLCQFHQK